MADAKITALAELDAIPDDADLIAMVDDVVGTATTKKMTVANFKKAGQEYMVPIWAEENSTLDATTYEWAFGNGATTPSDAGITIYVPSGWACTIVAMTATINDAAGAAVIEADINGALQGAACNVTVAGRSGENDGFTPVSISSGDRLTFRTTSVTTSTAPCTVCAWLRYVAT